MLFVMSWYPEEPWVELYREVPSAQAAGPDWDVASQQDHGGFACSRTLLWGLEKGSLARHGTTMSSVLMKTHGGLSALSRSVPVPALP